MTEAMPFLQKAILLSYDPRPLAGGIFLYSENLSSRPGFEIFSLLLLSSSAEPRKPPKSGLIPLFGAGMLPHSERDHTAAHRGGHMVSVLCTDSFCRTR